MNARCEIDRGPNWLFVRLSAAQLVDQSSRATTKLTDELWAICQRHFTYRLVVELPDADSLSREMTSALATLGQRVGEHDGSLRVCGLTPKCEQRLHAAHTPLKTFSNRREAVLCSDAHETTHSLK